MYSQSCSSFWLRVSVGPNGGSGLCCFVSSQVVCWWSIRCFIATVKLRTAQVAFYRTAGGKDGAGGFCVASYCSHRSQVRCLSSAGSLISHYLSRCIVYDFTSMGNKLVSFTKTYIYFFLFIHFFFAIRNNKILTIVNNKLKAYHHPRFVFQNQSSSFEGLINKKKQTTANKTHQKIPCLALCVQPPSKKQH